MSEATYQRLGNDGKLLEWALYAGGRQGIKTKKEMQQIAAFTWQITQPETSQTMAAGLNITHACCDSANGLPLPPRNNAHAQNVGQGL